MRQNFSQPTFLDEATRVYLELGPQGPLDRALIKEWMHYDWQTAFPGPAEKVPARTSRPTSPPYSTNPFPASPSTAP